MKYAGALQRLCRDYQAEASTCETHEHPGAAARGWAVRAAWGSPPHPPCLLEPAELSWDFLEPS